MIRVLFSSFLAASLMLSCSSQPKKEKGLDIDKISIVPLFENQLPVTIIGGATVTPPPVKKPKGKVIAKKAMRPTVLDDQNLFADVTAWNINDYVTKTYAAEFTALDKKLVDVPLDAKMIDAYRNEARGLKDIYLGDRWQNLTQYVLNEADKQGALYVLMVHPYTVEGFGQYKSGFGLFCPAQGRQMTALQGYTSIRAQIYDVKARKVTAMATITPVDVNFNTELGCDQARKMTPDEIVAKYKEQILEMVKSSVETSLRQTGIKPVQLEQEHN